MESSWEGDYRGAFEGFKRALWAAQEVTFPDYALEWFLYVDASDVAVGGVLVQVRVCQGVRVPETLTFVSKKFTELARRWSKIEKKAFAIYYTVSK